MSDSIEGLSSAWLSYHVFFRRDRLRVLLSFVLPLLRELFVTNRIESFFFIHYPEGGLHVRLRLLPCAGCRDTVATQVYAMYAAFTEKETWLEDGSVANETTLADILEASFEPETERYGGQELLGHSLEFFCISSVAALEFAWTYGGQPRTAQLSRAFRLLGHQALGLAGCADDFLALAGYMAARWDDSELSESASRGDRFFEQRRIDLCAAMAVLLRTFFEAFSSDPMVMSDEFQYVQAASLLSKATSEASAGARRSIGVSQMHMTANRLALDNQEEVYLARLLWRSANELSRTSPKLWNDLQNLYSFWGSIKGEGAATWSEVRRQHVDRLSRLGI